jgi:hypothetical protein
LDARAIDLRLESVKKRRRRDFSRFLQVARRASRVVGGGIHPSIDRLYVYTVMMIFPRERLFKMRIWIQPVVKRRRRRRVLSLSRRRV